MPQPDPIPMPVSPPVRPVVSILVISYNTREMTLDCLRSVREQTSVPHELIVLDNASSDGSAAAIAAEFPDVMLLAEQVNHGFAKANNIAATHAKGEYLLLLNPDTVVLDGALDKLLAFARKTPEARIWGGRTVFADGSLNAASCWRRMTLWSVICGTTGLSAVFRNTPFFNPEGYGGWDRSTERQVDIVTGCLFLISRADWDALGGFDPVFFMYGEEADLCLRAEAQIGAKPRVTPEAVIIHYNGASQQVRSDKMVRLLRAKHDLIQRHFPAWQRPIASALFALQPAVRSRAFALMSRLGLRKGAGEQARVWGEIWDRRAEWRMGHV
ncbi:glycosyltransferase family 2 protein [Tabrizicola sp. J26]|nr:glycosyltransferase family 2 protein [Tabrizicola rongguiensis]